MIELIWICFYAKVSFNFTEIPQTFKTVILQLVKDGSALTDLDLEARIFSLLSDIEFVNHIVQDGNLFLQISLDVLTLCLCNIFNSVLLGLENYYLFSAEGHFPFQVKYLIF